MDIVVRTGSTKTQSGTSLVSLVVPGTGGEQAFLLLQVHAAPRDAKTLEEESTEIVEHSLVGTDGEAWQRLDGTLKELNGLFKGLLIAGTVENIDAIVALVDRDGVLHVSHAGRAEAYLVRGGSTSQVTESARGKASPVFVHISSGQLEPRDAVVLSTQRALRAMTPAQLAHAAQRGDQLIDEVILKLESEREMAALAALHVEGVSVSSSRGRVQRMEEDEDGQTETRSRRHPLPLPDRRRARRGNGGLLSGLALPASIPSFSASLPNLKPLFSRLGSGTRKGASSAKSAGAALAPVAEVFQSLPGLFSQFLADLQNPKRRRRAHLLLLAGALAGLLLIWMIVRPSTSSQRSKTSAELEALLEQVRADVRLAENRYLTGDIDSANAVLARAEERGKQVLDSESGLFRQRALDLLDAVRSKSEEINNISRLSPRVAANIAAKNSDVTALGLIGLADSEFVVYDRQNAYRVLSNAVDDPERMSESELIVDGVGFSQYKTLAFLTNDNTVIETIGSVPTSMKTEDPAGWQAGTDMETYLRFLYILSPEKKQIYKYERLSNRYGPPVEYNVNGDLTGALDMAIDGSIYVLKQGGIVVKLLRGEVQTFVIRHAPEQVLERATKLFKVTDGHFYFLDAEHDRVIVTTDGGATGEAAYVRQYVLEGDQLGTLQDLYVDPDETHLYVMDEKRVYVVDLEAR